MFKDLGIKSRVLMLSLLPTSLLAVTLGGYFTWMQLSELQAQLLQRGQMMAEQLAAIAAPALEDNDSALLEQIADESLEHADTRSVRLYDAQHKLMAHAGPKMLNQAPSNSLRQLQVASSDSATHFQLAVTRRHLTHNQEFRRGEPGAGPRLGGAGAVPRQHIAARLPQPARQPAAGVGRASRHRADGSAHEPRHQQAAAQDQARR